ncbi:MAG: hypothetical protein HYZ31_14025 [Gammaproteobacteria bacterium]|nr:hypothetical protein [Gammaproteobacteria bacterium]
MLNKLPLALMLFIALVLSGQSQAATVSFNTSAQDVALGSSFTLDVLGTDFPAIVGGGLNLSFDASVLQISSVSINTAVFEFYPGNGTEEGVLNNVLGTLTDTSFNTFAGARGDFTIMSIGFTAVGSGSSLLQLSESSIWVFSDIMGNAIGNQILYADTTINVTAVPLPAAAWLFGSGLLVLARIMRRRN